MTRDSVARAIDVLVTVNYDRLIEATGKLFAEEDLLKGGSAEAAIDQSARRSTELTPAMAPQLVLLILAFMVTAGRPALQMVEQPPGAVAAEQAAGASAPIAFQLIQMAREGGGATSRRLCPTRRFKATLLNCLASAVPAGERVITGGEVFEITKIRQVHRCMPLERQEAMTVRGSCRVPSRPG